ncbi:MAG TPA: hypothetical protein PLM79_17150 [Syntrophobacteraceae bacterium]|nr:hypothetical protein [Syntrophobacteraceae bacterium]
MNDVSKRKACQENQHYVKQMAFIFFDRYKLIAGIFTTVFVLTLVWVLSLPPVYRSSAKFSVVIPQALDPLQRETYYDYKNRVIRYLQEQKELILSNTVLTTAVQLMFPELNPELLPKMVQSFREHVEVTPPKGETFEASSVFYITATGSNPHRVYRRASAITEAYMRGYGETTKAKTDYSYDFFKEQTQTLYNEMLEKEKALREYETKQAVSLIEMLNLDPTKTNLEVGPNALLTQFSRKSHELQEELAGLKTAIAKLEAEAKDDRIPVLLPEMEVTGRAITAFKNRVAQLQIQLNEMRPQFSDQFAPMKQVEKELDLNVRSLRDELNRSVMAQKITAQSIEAKIQELEKIIAALQERIRSTAEERSRYEHLKQQYLLAKDTYTHSRNQLEQARLANALNQEKQFITLVEKPEEPLEPFKPNRPVLILLGFLAGIFVSMATALTVDYFDHTLKTPEDIDCHLCAEVLGSVPRIG